MSSGEVFGVLLMFGLVSGLPLLVGLFIGYRWRARTHPQAKPDVPATDRQRAYLASLAVKREDGEAVMERLGITDPWAPSLSRGRVSAGIDILVKRPDRKLTKEDRAKLREVEAEREKRNPPEDDRELSDIAIRAIEEGRADHAAGRTVTMAELKRELLINS